MNRWNYPKGNLYSLALALLFGATFSSTSLAAQGFFPPNAMPAGLSGALEERARAASVRISIPHADGDRGRCSGAIVRADGIVVTAAHCFHDLLIAARAAALVRTGPRAAWVRVNRARAEGMVLEGVELVGKGLSSPTLLYIGSRYQQEVPGFDPVDGVGLHDRALRAYERGFTDVAVLRFGEASGLPCVPVSFAGPGSDGTRVYSVSTPFFTNRGANDAGGFETYASFGEVLSGFLRSAFITDRALPEATAARIDRALLGGAAFLTSLDAVLGSSGGMILNSLGELVGVVSITGSSPSRYFYGHTIGASLSGVDDSRFDRTWFQCAR